MQAAKHAVQRSACLQHKHKPTHGYHLHANKCMVVNAEVQGQGGAQSVKHASLSAATTEVTISRQWVYCIPVVLQLLQLQAVQGLPALATCKHAQA